MKSFWSFWTVTALAIGFVLLGGHCYATAQGVVIGSPKERFVPREVREDPNGYRTFHYWHVGSGGYRGGK